MTTLRHRLTVRRLALIGVSAILLFLFWHVATYPRGMVVAWFDAARGHYEIKTSGYPAPWQFLAWRILHDKYGVEVDHAGCVVTPFSLWYEDGYNAVSQSRIRRRFGKDVVAECDAKARMVWTLAQFLPRMPC